MPLDVLLDLAVAGLRRVFGDGLVAVAVFGSRARGDGRDDSDVDVYVVARELPADPFERGRLLSRAQPPAPEWALNILARTPGEFESDITPLHLELAVDARVLHDPDGWLAKRLALVRRRIEEAGLARGDDLVWRWRAPPATCDWSIGWDGVRT